MQLHGNLQGRQKLVAKEHAVVMLHVEQFYREHVGGALQFFLGHHQRRGMLLAVPPIRHRRDGRKRGKRTLAENAEQVQVGEFGLIFPGGGRTEENHTLQVLARGLFHAADEFSDLFFCNH